MSPDLHHLSGAYAVDALDDAERASFEQHLAVCADCRAEVAELSATAHSLGALTEATPPASLRDSVLSGIARVRPLPPLHEDAGEPAPVVTAPAADPAHRRRPRRDRRRHGIRTDGPDLDRDRERRRDRARHRTSCRSVAAAAPPGSPLPRQPP